MISFHCPLSDETRGMINSDFFGQLKNGSILVNTARGGLFESFDVLEQALEKIGSRSGWPVSGNHPLILRPGETVKTGLRADSDHSSSCIFPISLYEMRYKAAETETLFEHGS